MPLEFRRASNVNARSSPVTNGLNLMSLSITNNVNVRLLAELMEAYVYCRKKTEGFSKDVQNVSINPHLLHWMHTWKGSPFTKEENKLLLSKVNKLKKIHQTDLKTKMLLSSISTALESKIQIQKE